MSKDIRTQEAKLDLVKKFLDYAECADASYALLEYTQENYKIDEDKKDFGDGFKLGSTANTNGQTTLTTYARAIEARFNQNKVIEKNLIFPNKTLDNNIQNISKEIDSTQYKDDKNCHIFNTNTNQCLKLYPKELSDRTINFTSRFKLLHHQPNTTSGFSATLFGEKRKQINKKTKEVTYTSQYGYTNYILSIRGTTPNDTGDLRADARMALGYIPQEQYEDMLLFYHQCKGEIPFYVDIDSMPKGKDNSILCDKLNFDCNHSLDYTLWHRIYNNYREFPPYINPMLLKDKNGNPTQSNFIPPIDSKNSLTITGHSLGGAITQLFALSFATDKESSIIKEVYTFNSPGAKNLKPLNLDNVYEIDSTILSDANKDNKERALFKKIRDYEYENSNLLKDAILINYDSGLLNTIHKYFSNNENLKEHSIFLRTFTSTRLMPLWYGGVLSNATYSYEIIKINEIFMKCITNLKDNYQLQKPLACKDNIHHIEADNDSNPNNNKLIGNLIHNDKNVA